MGSIAIKLSRRCVASLLGSIAVLYASGTFAGENRNDIIIGTHFPEGFVPSGGPRLIHRSLDSTHHGNGLDAVHSAESRPPLTQDRIGNLATSMEQKRIQVESGPLH
jgi:hypothetical protein